MTEREVSDELYGALLSADEAIDNTGGGTLMFLIVMSIVVCVGLHLGYHVEFLGEQFAQLDGWGVYFAVVVVFFAFGGFIANVQEKVVYNRYRGDIENFMVRSRLGRYEMVSKLEEKEELSHVLPYVKKDLYLGENGHR